MAFERSFSTVIRSYLDNFHSVNFCINVLYKLPEINGLDERFIRSVIDRKSYIGYFIEGRYYLE